MNWCGAAERPGELFDLEEELRQFVGAFRARRPLVSGEDARTRTSVGLAAERAAREGGEVTPPFSWRRIGLA
jgi:predicted dehydrogenase